MKRKNSKKPPYFSIKTSGDFFGKNVGAAINEIKKASFSIMVVNDGWLHDQRAKQECWEASMRDIPKIILIDADMKRKTELPIWLFTGRTLGTVNIYDNDLKAAAKVVNAIVDNCMQHGEII